jgi:hypothetical protein
MVTRIVQGWKELDTNAQLLGDIVISDGSLRTFGEAVTAYAVGAATSVPSNSQTTVVTLTANGINMITMISCSGDSYAKWQMYINNTLKETQRSGPDRNIRFYFSHPYTINAGDVVDVKVTHYYTGDTLNFESTIYGFKYTAPVP